MAGQGQETIAIHLTQDQAVALRTAIRIVRRWIDEGIRDAETGQFRIPEEVADETDRNGPRELPRGARDLRGRLAEHRLRVLRSRAGVAVTAAAEPKAALVPLVAGIRALAEGDTVCSRDIQDAFGCGQPLAWEAIQFALQAGLIRFDRAIVGRGTVKVYVRVPVGETAPEPMPSTLSG